MQLKLTDAADGAYCDGGRGGYADINSDTVVTVYDAAGKVIGTGPLGSDCHQALIGGQYDTSSVSWTTKIADLPDERFYQVEIGHRGKLTFSRSQVAANGWVAVASLG